MRRNGASIRAPPPPALRALLGARAQAFGDALCSACLPLPSRLSCCARRNMWMDSAPPISSPFDAGQAGTKQVRSWTLAPSPQFDHPRPPHESLRLAGRGASPRAVSSGPHLLTHTCPFVCAPARAQASPKDRGPLPLTLVNVEMVRRAPNLPALAWLTGVLAGWPLAVRLSGCWLDGWLAPVYLCVCLCVWRDGSVWAAGWVAAVSVSSATRLCLCLPCLRHSLPLLPAIPCICSQPFRA
jgi:hypothetical protein